MTSVNSHIHAQLVASTENAAFVEFMPDDSIVNFRRLIDFQLEARDGHLILPDRPGLGFAFAAEAVQAFGAHDNGDSLWHRIPS